jgi:hypothetical protein
MCKVIRLFSGRIFAEFSNILALVLLWLGLSVNLDPTTNTALTITLIIVIVAIFAATLSRIFFIDNFKLFELLAYLLSNILNGLALGIALVSLFTAQNSQFQFTLGLITWGLAEFVDTFAYLKKAQGAQRVARRASGLSRAEANVIMRSSRFATALGFVGVIKASLLGIFVLINLATNWPNPQSPPGFTVLLSTTLLIFFLLALFISILRRASDYSIENTLFRSC